MTSLPGAETRMWKGYAVTLSSNVSYIESKRLESELSSCAHAVQHNLRMCGNYSLPDVQYHTFGLQELYIGRYRVSLHGGNPFHIMSEILTPLMFVPFLLSKSTASTLTLHIYSLRVIHEYVDLIMSGYKQYDKRFQYHIFEEKADARQQDATTVSC